MTITIIIIIITITIIIERPRTNFRGLHFPEFVHVEFLVFDFLERFLGENGKLAQRRFEAPNPLVYHLTQGQQSAQGNRSKR